MCATGATAQVTLLETVPPKAAVAKEVAVEDEEKNATSATVLATLPETAKKKTGATSAAP